MNDWRKLIVWHEQQVRAAIIMLGPYIGRPEPKPSCHERYGHPIECRCVR